MGRDLVRVPSPPIRLQSRISAQSRGMRLLGTNAKAAALDMELLRPHQDDVGRDKSIHREMQVGVNGGVSDLDSWSG